MGLTRSGFLALTNAVWGATSRTLTAGSYSVRASSMQRGTIALNNVASNTAAVSSVTTTRAQLASLGHMQETDTQIGLNMTRIELTSAVLVTAVRTGTSSSAIVTKGYELMELF